MIAYYHSDTLLVPVCKLDLYSSVPVSLSLQLGSFRHKLASESKRALGNKELAGSQVTKHSAPDSQLGQMAGLQHDGTNIHKDGEEEGEVEHHTHTHMHTHPYLSAPLGVRPRNSMFHKD